MHPSNTFLSIKLDEALKINTTKIRKAFNRT